MKKVCFCFWFIIIALLSSCTHKKPLQADSVIENLLQKGEETTIKDEIRQKYLDSANIAISHYKNDSVTRFLLRRTAAAYYQIEQFDKAIAVSKMIYNLAAKANDSVSMEKALYLPGLAYYQKGTPDSALQYYRKAEKIYRLRKDPDLGMVILYKAYIFHDVGEYVLCESEAFIALKLLQEQHKNTEIFQCFVVIASALNEQDNTDDAIYYYNQALSQVDKLKADGYSDEVLESYRISCYSNIGLVYIKKKQYDKAIKEYNKALASNVLVKNGIWGGRIINNLAHAKFLKGDKAGVKDMYFKALKISDSLDNKQEILTSSLNIGSLYAAQKDTAKAIYYFKNAYKNAQEINSISEKLSALKELSAMDVKNSVIYSKEYVVLNDSIQKVSLHTRNKFARIEYETDKLKDEKDALIKKNSFIIGVSAVVLLFVAAIFMIYYLNSRNKELVMAQEQQKANEEIYQLMFEQQTKVDSARADEKNRIAMELHDGILNNIYAVRLNLEFNNKKTDELTIEKRKGFIKELQGVESEIRAVSHDLARNAILEQDKGFDAILSFMIVSQKNTFDTEFSADIDTSIDWEQMPNTYKVNIYRIVQEALQNVNKYAHAAHAKVAVTLDEHNLITVRVTDDGIGFDTTKASGGIGMRNLKKRTDALNGNLLVQSSAGEGTSIVVQFSM